jgi:hypothetical protein
MPNQLPHLSHPASITAKAMTLRSRAVARNLFALRVPPIGAPAAIAASSSSAGWTLPQFLADE